MNTPSSEASDKQIALSADYPKVSIIIATWNAERTLKRCLLSIFEQEFTDWELLIADGASTDSTVEIIRTHASRITWWQSEPDKGIYDAWNHALAHARGEYVCFLGADDAWADEHALVRLFDAIGQQNYDLVTSRGLMIRNKPGRRDRFGAAWAFRKIGRRMIVCHPGLLHRRALFKRFGGFDIRYRIAGDLDFLLRLPSDIRALDVESDSVLVEGGGVSRKNVLARLREQREILSCNPRFGPLRAYLVWLDKLWRFPIAQLLNISH